MPLTIVGARHWETGEDHTDFVNISGIPPGTDEVTTSGTDDGTYCKRYVFASNKDVRIENNASFTRGSINHAMLAQWTLKVSNVSDFDALALGLMPTTSTGVFPISVRFNVSGGGEVYRHNIANNLNNTSGTVLGTFPNGSLQSGVKQVVTLRCVHHASTGEIQVKINETIVLNLSGINTVNSGTVQTGWGWGIFLSSQNGAVAGDGNVRISNMTFASDGTITDLKPQKYKAYVPDGTVAPNQGVIFGGAPTVQAALDEIPATSADGINLNTAGHGQGLTWPTPSESNINTVAVWGAVGDPAAGSEQIRCDVFDGVATNTGTAFGLSASFAARRLSNLVHTPPGAASWDVAKPNIESTIVRTV